MCTRKKNIKIGRVVNDVSERTVWALGVHTISLPWYVRESSTYRTRTTSPLGKTDGELVLKIHEETSARANVLVVAGELTGETVAQFRKHLVNAFSVRPIVVLEMAAVTQIDSAGLAACVAAMQSCQEPQQFGICQLSPVVKEAIAMTRLQELIGTFDSRQEALSGLHRR